MITLSTGCTCQACAPHGSASWSDMEAGFVDTLRHDGWHVITASNPVGPAWSYTVGLWHLFRSPEVVVFGLPDDLRDYCLERVFDGIGFGRTPAANVLDHKVFDDAPVTYRSVHASWVDELFPYLTWTYPQVPPVLQAVWGDLDGHFPWDPGFDPGFEGFQPDTWRPLDGRWARAPDDALDSSWPQARHLHCITFPWVLDGSRPAAYVSRHLDDVWQVLDDADVTDLEDQAVVVPLSELIDVDVTLVEFATLPKGWEARRRRTGEPWERFPQQDPS